MKLDIATWKYAKRWVYSITYDEALADLERYVIPAHLELGIPGHVEVVASQIGQTRAIGQSSYNGFRHMNAKELMSIAKLGWGIGCHSWSHDIVLDNPERELRTSREVIEDAIGAPVTLYTAPGTNANLVKEIQDMLEGYGYLGGMSITDDINLPDGNALPWINRVPIHERYPGVFNSAFDPFKRIRQAEVEHGWIVDYCHCPLEKAVHENKDCSAAHHKERLEAIVSEGGAECWYANPEDVVDYILTRRACTLKDDGDGRFIVNLSNLNPRVQRKELTFIINTPHTPETLIGDMDGVPLGFTQLSAGKIIFTIDFVDGSEITIRQRKG